MHSSDFVTKSLPKMTLSNSDYNNVTS